jgi:hypothetical protein
MTNDPEPVTIECLTRWARAEPAPLPADDRWEGIPLPAWAVDRAPDGRPSACFWHEVPDFDDPANGETSARPETSDGGSTGQGSGSE